MAIKTIKIIKNKFHKDLKTKSCARRFAMLACAGFALALLCQSASAIFGVNPVVDVQIVRLPEQSYAGGESFFIVVLENDQIIFDESLKEEGAVGVDLNITNGIFTSIESVCSNWCR